VPDRPLLDNAALSELLVRAAADEQDHRRRALDRASKAAWTWGEEAVDVAAAGRSLTELSSVGPWVAAKIEAWLEAPPPLPDPDETRRGFVTFAWVRSVLDADPTWEALPHGDLQTHSTDSDGKLTLEEMADAARARGRTFVAATDHSKSLTIARGQTEEELRDQGRRIDELNAGFADRGEDFRVLRSIEMDVFDDGTGDMDPDALAELDLVLGAFHSKLRIADDQTDRYVAALRNPSVDVIAHPRARMFGRRGGIRADWPKVFAEAARTGKALEIDANARRQDLDLESVRLAVAEGVRWFSIGSDAHNAGELDQLPIGLAIAAAAGVQRDRILNFLPSDGVVAWARTLRAA
jgi:histidinol phosphatase-like PHP family hydrolase